MGDCKCIVPSWQGGTLNRRRAASPVLRLVERGVVKITNSRLECHDIKPLSAEDPPCRGVECTLNMSRLKRPTVDVVWKVGEEGANTQVSFSSLDQGSKL
ncbi:hypothetical protein TNCV_954281 [Trichonephila clavipes]|nr:hypothetical protein TNCV_954281 [Trichonephila clavipes]